MTDPNYTWMLSVTLLAMTMILSVAGLVGWRDWIALKRDELDRLATGAAGEKPDVTNRIALADLRERLRKLEETAVSNS